MNAPNPSPSHMSSSYITERLSVGYRRVGSFLTVTLGVAFFAVGISLAIVLPLWLLATSFPSVYSAVIGVSLGVFLLFVLVRAIRIDRARRLRAVALRSGLVLCAAATGYTVAALIATGNLLLGIPLGILLILAVGFFCGSPGK